MLKKSESRRSKLALLMALIAVAITAIAVRPMHATVAPAAADGAYGFTTAAVTFGGQRKARLTVRNKGDEPVLARLQLVDKGGKVLVWRDSSIKPGGYDTVEAPSFHGGVSNGIRAQFGTNSKRLVGLLMPTLEIIEKVNGSVVETFGRESFSEFRPVFNPPLADVESDGGPHE